MPAKRRTTARQARHWLEPLARTPRANSLQGPLELIGSERRATLRAITAAQLSASMSSMAQLRLSVVDPDRKLLGPFLDRDEDLLLDDNIDLELGGTATEAGIWWRLQGIAPTNQGWDLSFEDRSAAWLRRHTRPIKATRYGTNRAQFVRRLYAEAGGGIPLYVPELLDKQQIARGTRPSETAKATKAARDNTTDSSTARDLPGGWPAAEKPKVKGVVANPAQLKAIVGVLEECRVQGCSRRVAIAALMAATQESTMTIRAGTTGDDDTGLFQQGRPWISLANVRDPRKCTRAFLLGGTAAKVGGTGGVPGWKQKHGSLRNASGSLTQLIADVQQPAARYRGEYARWEEEATRTFELWEKAGGGAGVASTSSGSSTRAKTYVFERGQDGRREDSVTCLGRLADEVGWNHWVFGNAGVFASDDELAAAPKALVVDRDDRGCLVGPTWRWDVRRPISDLTVELLVDRLPEPGQVALVENEGPASGLWLVDQVDCDLAVPVDTANGGLALRVSLSLVRAGKKKPEPATSFVTKESSPDEKSEGKLRRNGNKVTGGTLRERIVFAAKESARLDAEGKRLRRANTDRRTPGYSQGGKYTVSQGITGESSATQRSDCSQWVAAMYWSAGAGDPSGQQFNAGYTGTLYANADRVSSPLPGDLCMYGPPPGIHVELYVGNDKTIGHGDANVDYSKPKARNDFAGYYRPRVLKAPR